MKCIYCESERVVKNGKNQSGGKLIQRYLCRGCGRRSNERSGTPIASLQTPRATIALAMKVSSEGLGIRATGRVVGVAANSVINWEKHLAAARSNWSPPAPAEREITIEGDEVYTRVGENFPPAVSEGWTIHFVERKTHMLNG
jgi:transposase-like protein